MIDVNNWVKERRPIVYQLDADGRRVRLNSNQSTATADKSYRNDITAIPETESGRRDSTTV